MQWEHAMDTSTQRKRCAEERASEKLCSERELQECKRTCKSHSGTSSWRLVHLAEDESNLGLAIEVDDLGLLHFMVQVVALASALTDAGED